MQAFNRPFNEQATFDDIISAYRLLLKRYPDDPALQHYQKIIPAGLSLEALVQGILDSPEFMMRSTAEEALTEVEIDGRFIYARLKDQSVGNEIIRQKSYEPHVTRILSSILIKNGGQTFVDIGANIGFFVILAASIVGAKGTIIAVEPNPDNVQLILRSVVRSGYKNIHILPYAASDQETVFEIITGGSNGHVISTKDLLPHSLFTQSIVLDEHLEKYQKIDIVKIDIEGHEPKAIKGFRKSLRKFTPAIVTEFHPSALIDFGGNDPEEYLSELFGLHRSACIILKDGSLKKCWLPKEIMQFWKEINLVNNTQGLLHLDLLFSSD